MLVLSGENRIKDPKLHEFVFYGQKAVKWLAKQKSRFYPEFAPNKPSVRVAKSKLMKSRQGHISFGKLCDQKLIDICYVLEEKQPVFKGPLRKIIDTDFSC